MGEGALYTNVDGSNSVAIGRLALYNQEPASAIDMDNVAVGYKSGTSVTTGVKNALLGNYAGEFLTTGNNSVFVGFESGKGITGNKLTGGDNVGVGYPSRLFASRYCH